MSMEAYRVPAAVRAGVEIPLPQAPENVFRVRLPSQHNRAFTRAVQAAMFAGATVGATGRVEMGTIDVAGLRDARLDAFCQHCLMMPLPGGMSLDTLRDEFFPALDYVFSEAERQATALDREGDDAAKKSLPTSRGKSAG